MIEIEINKENLIKFIDDLKPSDKEELEYFYKEDCCEKFIKIVLENDNKHTYFLADENYNPVALGGALRVDSKRNIGQVWLLSTNKINKHKVFLYSYIKKKIAFFKEEYNILFNYIYKSNFSALKWLKKCGFGVKVLDDKNYKLFYFNKGEKL